MKISYYKNIKLSKEKDINFFDLANDIKNGKYKESVERLRILTGKEKSDLKNSLPAVTLSGIFDGQHKANNIIEHSGLIQIDIDKVNDVSELQSQLYADKYTFCGFISPSGNGIKLVVQIPSEIPQHKAYFLALEQYYKKQYDIDIDKACKDVSRLCYISHDPELFLNENAEIYTDIYTVPVIKNKNILPPKQSQNCQRNSTNEYYYSAENFDEFVNEMERQNINIADSYDDWLKVGFAISNEFRTFGLNYFDKISRLSSKYNTQTVNDQYNKCLKSNDGTIEIKTVFSMAKRAGLTIPKTDNKTISYQSSITPKTDSNDNPELIANRDEYNYYRNIDINEILEAEIPQSIDIENDIDYFGAYSQSNTYYNRVHIGKTTKDVVISNFVFSILFQFDDGTQDTRRLIKFKNAHTGENGIIELTDSQLSSIEKFTSALSSKNCLFNGNKRDLIGILGKLYLYQQKSDYINILGYNKKFDFYAFSNAIITNTGEVKEVNNIGLVKNNDKLFYLPHWAESNLDNPAYNEERNIFLNKNSNITINECFNLMFKAYKLQGIICSLFLVNAILYDLIFNVTKFFPYLFLFGEPGTGKTSLTNLILGAFGKDIKGVSVKGSTFKGTARKFSQYQNSVIYLKEFDNDPSPEYDSLLKTVYDGSSYTIAQKSNDNKTQTFDVKSGIMIDGNVLPINQEAVYDRIILIELRSGKFTNEQAEAFEKINAIYESTGLTNITIEINMLRTLFEKEYRETFSNILARIKNNSLLPTHITNILKDRTQRHISFLLATAYLLIKNKALSNDNFNFNDIAEQLINDSIEKESIMSELKETTIFWEAFQHDLNKPHYSRNIQNNNSKEYIVDKRESRMYISFLSLYNNYAKYCSSQKRKFLDKTTMQKLLTSKEYCSFYPNPSNKDSRQTYTKNNVRMYCFILNALDNDTYVIDNIELDIPT